MGQFFELVNFDKRVRVAQYKFMESTGAVLHRYLTQGRGFSGYLVTDLGRVRETLEEKARRPNMWEQCGRKTPSWWKDMRPLLPAMHPQTQSPLLRLMPTEIIDMVFLLLAREYHQSPWRMVPLAMTCQRCYEIGVRRINQFLGATWCGDRIAFVGEYCKPKHMPAGMTWTPEEREEYGLDEEDPPSLHDITELRGWSGPLRSESDVRKELEWAACSFETPPAALYDLEPDTPPEVRLWHFFRANMYAGQFFRPDMWFTRKAPDVPPRDPTAVEFVLNHSKSEYVRWDTCQDIADRLAWSYPDAKRRHMENVCTVVRAALCWSPDCPLRSKEYPLVNTVTRGCWAGDRISLRDMPKDEPMLGWKDRTSEFMAQFVELMRYDRVVNEGG